MNQDLMQRVRAGLGVQAWSLRDELAGGVEQPFEFLGKLGFQQVELYSLHDLTPENLKASLARAGLSATAYHGLIEDWRTRPEALFSDAAALGVKRIGIAWLKQYDGETVAIDHIRETLSLFKTHAERLKQLNIIPYYHIHGYEFAPFENGTLFDVLFEGLRRTGVEYELDVFWAQHAGQNVVDLMDRLSDRLTMLHLKDMRAGTPGDFTGETNYDNFVPVGTGILDFDAILAKAVELGVETYWIEDESPQPRSGLAASLAYFGIQQGRVK